MSNFFFKFKFTISTMCFTVALLACLLGWILDKRQTTQLHERQLQDVCNATEIATRSKWVAWHHSPISKTNGRSIVVSTLLSIFKQRQLITESSKNFQGVYSAELHAAELLQNINVSKASEYFEWAAEEIESSRLAYAEAGISEYILLDSDIHHSKAYQEFIEDACRLTGKNRIILP